MAVATPVVGRHSVVAPATQFVPGGRFLMVNNSLVQSTGYSREELLRMTYWDITPPEWRFVLLKGYRDPNNIRFSVRLDLRPLVERKAGSPKV